MVFSRKYRWPEHYFFVWCLENSQKLPTNQFLVSAILFTNIDIFFFNLRFNRFSIIAKKSESNQEQYSLCCSSPCFFCFAVHSLQDVAMLFKYFCKLKEIWVLRPILQDYVISCDYGKSKFHVCYHFFSYENPRGKSFINPSCPKHPKIITWNKNGHLFESPKRKVKRKKLCHFPPLFGIGTTRVKNGKQKRVNKQYYN